MGLFRILFNPPSIWEGCNEPTAAGRIRRYENHPKYRRNDYFFQRVAKGIELKNKWKAREPSKKGLAKFQPKSNRCVCHACGRRRRPNTGAASTLPPKARGRS